MIELKISRRCTVGKLLLRYGDLVCDDTLVVYPEDIQEFRVKPATNLPSYRKAYNSSFRSPFYCEHIPKHMDFF